VKAIMGQGAVFVNPVFSKGRLGSSGPIIDISQSSTGQLCCNGQEYVIPEETDVLAIVEDGQP
jgi:co-chaperonin GroES (HSP10)